MNWEALVASVLAVLGGVWALYEKYRKRVAADDTSAIGQWRTYAKEREKQHRDDIARLEREIAASRSQIDRLVNEERRCALVAARQEQQIKQQEQEIKELRDELADLKRELAEQGIRDGSEHHRPL